MTASHPLSSLLAHEGELSDLRALIEELGTPFVERPAGLVAEDLESAWDLVIATPKQMLALYENPTHEPRAQIAVLDHDSRTLHTKLSRAGIRQMVRRPVHPAALRALILHALYRGPERRMEQRVAIGAAIRFRVGWKASPGILADLSLGGCRLLSGTRVPRGRVLRLRVPAAIAGGRSFAVKARVQRWELAQPGQYEMTAIFEQPSAAQRRKLRATIVAHREGPALFEASPTPARPSEEADEILLDVPDRRAEARRELDRRVIALGEEAARVLIGRDISVGGMRVDANPLIEVGREFQLAVHVGDRPLPLVLPARVHRDDGERGAVLVFHDLAPEARDCLVGMIEQLPLVESGGETVLVSEIVDPPEAAQFPA